MSPEIRAPVSIEEFWRLGSRFPNAELVAGQVIELVPPGFRHGLLASELDGRLREHAVGRVASKIGDYLRAGTQAVWVVDPEAQTLTVHTRDGSIRYGPDEVLRGGPPLPDFELALKDLFA